MDRLNEDSLSYIQAIIRSVDRMKILVRDLLEYSRVGKIGVTEKVDCNEIMKAVLADMDGTIRATLAQVEVGPLPSLIFNSTQLGQLFQNFISNAIKFRKKGVIPAVKISAVREEQSWRFCFQDNGIGIDEKYKDRIFLLFQRLHSRSQYEGSGIGLSLCKKIVETNGGQVDVQSRLGEGSTFSFSIKDTE